MNVYGPQTLESKSDPLDYLQRSLQTNTSQSWIIGGDFNMITSLREKKGCCRILSQEDPSFKELVENCNLVDLETPNGLLTWNNNRGGIDSRLDRFLFSDTIVTSVGSAEDTILRSVGSDHWPICLVWHNDGTPS